MISWDEPTEDGGSCSLEQASVDVEYLGDCYTLCTLRDLIDGIVQRPSHICRGHGFDIEFMVDLVKPDVRERLDLFLQVEFGHIGSVVFVFVVGGAMSTCSCAGQDPEKRSDGDGIKRSMLPVSCVRSCVLGSGP